MGLLLEFFIIVFGVPWLIYKAVTRNSGVNRLSREIEQGKELSQKFSEKCAASEEEHRMACLLAQAHNEYGYDEYVYESNCKKFPTFINFEKYPKLYSHTFFELIGDELAEVYGKGNEEQYRKYYITNRPMDWTTALILSKDGKVNPNKHIGGPDGFSFYSEKERAAAVKVAQCVARNLRDNGIEVSLGISKGYLNSCPPGAVGGRIVYMETIPFMRWGDYDPLPY